MNTAKTAKAPKAPKAASVGGPTAAQKRAATVASNRQKKIDARGYALPLVLTCKVTGKEVKYTSPAYIDKVIAKNGGTLESLRNTFVSREGRRIQKAAATPAPAPAPAAAPAAATATP